MKPTLVILAAGIGSRYGSIKQLDKMGPSGETILDYSAYDAMRAGFGKIVFVIRKNLELDFRNHIISKIEKHIACDIAFQELDIVPEGIIINPDRVKPWGTAHAVLVSKDVVEGNFAVINADDFYGFDAFNTMATYLQNLKKEEYAMVGYPIQKTLSDYGSVSRGVCEISNEGFLSEINERTKIERHDGIIQFLDNDGTMKPLTGKETVSMNFWGFTQSVYGYIEEQFRTFIHDQSDNLKAEMYIPNVADSLIKSGILQTQVLNTTAEWFGITYKEDKASATKRLKKLTQAGEYPVNLWK